MAQKTGQGGKIAPEKVSIDESKVLSRDQSRIDLLEATQSYEGGINGKLRRPNHPSGEGMIATKNAIA